MHADEAYESRKQPDSIPLTNNERNSRFVADSPCRPYEKHVAAMEKVVRVENVIDYHENPS
jgi:hypothetical protein